MYYRFDGAFVKTEARAGQYADILGVPSVLTTMLSRTVDSTCAFLASSLYFGSTFESREGGVWPLPAARGACAEHRVHRNMKMLRSRLRMVYPY